MKSMNGCSKLLQWLHLNLRHEIGHQDSSSSDGCQEWHALLTHLPLVLHIYASENWVSIGLDNGFSPNQRQAIIWTNAGLLPIGPLGIKLQWNFIKIQNASFTKMHLKISSAKWRQFCLGGDELTDWYSYIRASMLNPCLKTTICSLMSSKK